jgi:hypothetical protein
MLPCGNGPLIPLFIYGGFAVSDDVSSLPFSGFVLSLVTTAAVHFGDYPDPVSGESKAPNLEGAKQMIDILTMLEQKTRGNLTAQERSLLEQVLYELRMRFVAATKEAAVQPTTPS